MKVSPTEIDHGWTKTEERLVIDTTPALIHTALPDGNIDFFNRRWLEYLGLALEDVQGWRWTAAIHPEDVAGIVDKWRRSLATGEPFEAETRVRRADGVYRWFLHRKVALRDDCGKIVRWYGSSIDIEDRKQAESLRAAEKRTLEMIADGAGHATACHRAAELPPGEVVVPHDGGFSPALERLVAAFSLSTEGPPQGGVDIVGASPPAGV